MERGKKGKAQGHIIEISEEQFAEWLTDYRASVARRAEDED